jgi:serine/threonine-protein kinase
MQGSTVFVVAFFTSVLTSAGSVYLIQKYEMIPAKEAAKVIVPRLEGLSEKDARANAQAVQIPVLVSGREPSADHADGIVIRQSVPAGQPVPPNHPVSVVLAEALPLVPKVVGLSVEKASAKLEEAGFEVEAAPPKPHPSVAAGEVIEQDPKAGKALKKGAKVSIVSSSGASEVEVPKVLGMAVGAAKKKVDEMGLEGTVRWVSLAETASGVVLRQKPEPGAKAEPKSQVEMIVNR